MYNLYIWRRCNSWNHHSMWALVNSWRLKVHTHTWQSIASTTHGLFLQSRQFSLQHACFIQFRVYRIITAGVQCLTMQAHLRPIQRTWIVNQQCLKFINIACYIVINNRLAWNTICSQLKFINLLTREILKNSIKFYVIRKLNVTQFISPE